MSIEEAAEKILAYAESLTTEINRLDMETAIADALDKFSYTLMPGVEK